MTSPLVLGPVGDVPLGRINPVAQLLAIAVVLPLLLVSGDVVTPAVVLAAELCLLPAAGLAAPRELLARTWPLLLSAAGVAWLNVALADEGTGWLAGVGLAVRVVALALPGILLVSSTDPVRLADALIVHWRVPARFAYGALAALRLVPLLATEWQTIRLARRARGIEAGRSPAAHLRLFASTAFALLVAAVRRATRLATAMDARGFDSHAVRTHARSSRLHPRDAAFVASAVAVSGLAVALSVGSGNWSPVLG